MTPFPEAHLGMSQSLVTPWHGVPCSGIMLCLMSLLFIETRPFSSTRLELSEGEDHVSLAFVYLSRLCCCAHQLLAKSLMNE